MGGENGGMEGEEKEKGGKVSLRGCILGLGFGGGESGGTEVKDDVCEFDVSGKCVVVCKIGSHDGGLGFGGSIFPGLVKGRVFWNFVGGDVLSSSCCG